MKNTIFLLATFLGIQNLIAQTFEPNQAKECPPPKFQKGQNSAQVNEATRKYVECVKEFKKREDERKAQRNRELAAEKERKDQENQRLREERERNRENARLDREKLQEERRKQELERRNQIERERQKRELESQNQPEVQG